MSENRQNQPFVTGHSWKTVLAVFVVGCLAGTLWEEILYLIQHGEWVSRTGTVIGPFSPIYGYGAIIFALVLGPGNAKRPIWKTYLYSCLIGGVTEFALSFIAETVFHEIIWDYSQMPLNICGRTTVPFMLAWGLGGLLLMKLIYPLFIKLLSHIPNKIGLPVWIVLAVFMATDLVLTYSALGRQSLRQQGKAPVTFLGQFCDTVYTDEWLAERFPAIGFNDTALDTAKPSF